MAGIQNHRLFYDTDFKVVLELPENQRRSFQSFTRLFKIEMSLLRRSEQNTIRSAQLFTSRGNILSRNGIFELTAREGSLNFTIFYATD